LGTGEALLVVEELSTPFCCNSSDGCVTEATGSTGRFAAGSVRVDEAPDKTVDTTGLDLRG